MKRKATIVVEKPQKRVKTGLTIVKATGGPQRQFVPRALGTPLAITERKYFDTEVSAVALAQLTTNFASAEVDPTTLNTLFAPVTGDDFNNRTGRKVQVIGLKLSVRVDCAAQADQTAVDSAAMVRLLVVQDRQTNAAQLNSEDVITSGAANGATLMFQNPAFFGRFRVLKDKRLMFHPVVAAFDGTNVEQGGVQKYFKVNIKFKKPVVVHFNGTNGGTVADIVDNSFHVIGGCSNNSMAPTITYKARTTFVDV